MDIIVYLCGMNFTSQVRYNPKTGRDERYYRLKESYRNALGRSCTRILLNVGFVDDLLPEEMRDISRALTYKYEHQDDKELWPDALCVYSERVRARALEYWGEMVKLAIAHLIVRTVYTPSELKSMHIMRDNTAVCQLLDLAMDAVTHRKVYSVADWFMKEKVKIEKYLCHKTDDLFKPTNRIMLFDLTNFYFEGRKENSRKAKFGRSKEKRSDCKLLVLALCINTDGFIRYSSVLEGNTAEPKSLPDMVGKLTRENPAKCADDEKVL